MYFCLKDSVRRRLEGYAALYKTENRGRRRAKKSNSIAYKCIIHWGRIEREIAWWEIETPMVQIHFCVGGLCACVSVGERQKKKKKQKAMSSQSIIGNGRFSNLILLIELNPDLGPPLQINWRRAIDVLVGITWLWIAFGWKRLWLKLSFKANTIEIKWHD